MVPSASAWPRVPAFLIMGRAAREGMRTVLVVARHTEDLAWLKDVPPEIEVCIINKGPPLHVGGFVFQRDNVGREAESYVAYLVSQYDSLPDRIIFSQGDPFEHSPHFLDLLKEHRRWTGFQPLSLQYKHHLPPSHTRGAYNRMAEDRRVWLDRMDCVTLDTVFYRDTDVAHFRNLYLNNNRASRSCNIAQHLFDRMGCQHHKGSSLDELNFPFGAIFSVDRKQVLQHDTEVYQRILQGFKGDDSLPYILERTWMGVFDLPGAEGESPWSLPLSFRNRTPLAENGKLATSLTAPGTFGQSERAVHPARDFTLVRNSRVLNL